MCDLYQEASSMNKPGKKGVENNKKKGVSKQGAVLDEQKNKGTAIPEFPSRLFTKDDEPLPGASINYFSKPSPLLESVKNVLQADEWEEIRNSPLGVLIDFFEVDVSWASRLVHWVLSFQLECNKNHEIWSLIGSIPIRFSIIEFAHITGLNCDYIENLMDPGLEVTGEMLEFWTLLGVSVETGPSYEDLAKACDLCEDWEREDRLRLGYLSLLATFIDAKAHTGGVNLKLARLVMDLEQFREYPWGRVAFKILIKSVRETDITKNYHLNGFAQALQSWVFYALPKFASEYGLPNQSVHTPPLLAYGGAKGRRGFKDGMLKQVL